jgi:hypothetical protein
MAPSQGDFRTLITAGHNGGSWSGTAVSGAINSSLAASSGLLDGVGYGLGAQVAPTSIGSFAIAPADTLLRYTLDGNANLDDNIDVADLGILASNWQQSPRSYSLGDFDYSGTVEVNDLGMLASNWQVGLPPAAPSCSRVRIPIPVIDLIAKNQSEA